MNFKILIVEDNVDSRELLHFYLTSSGFQVVTAMDGLEGVYKTKLENPDVIITDLAMPNMNGLGLIKFIRSEPEIAKTFIIVCTSYAAFTQEEILATGANKIFYKPVNLEKMREYIIKLANHPKEN